VGKTLAPFAVSSEIYQVKLQVTWFCICTILWPQNFVKNGIKCYGRGVYDTWQRYWLVRGGPVKVAVFVSPSARKSVCTHERTCEMLNGF